MDELRTELEALTWNELRRKAIQDYGIKLLPEYKAVDIIRLIMDKEQGQTKFITESTPLENKSKKWGWSRIKVFRNSKEPKGNTHCRACHNGYQFAIPYGVEVNIPTITAEYLTTKKTPVPQEDSNGNTQIMYEDRWIVNFIEKNYGPNGETDYVPPEQAGKYWNKVREAKLSTKRKFFEQFNFWPTDKVLKEHMSAGMFNNIRRDNG